LQIFEDGKPICLPVQTAYRHHIAVPDRSLHTWNEWLSLPIRYSDLPRTAVAVVTIWDNHGPGMAIAVGGTTVPLFGKYGTFKKVLLSLLNRLIIPLTLTGTSEYFRR